MQHDGEALKTYRVPENGLRCCLVGDLAVLIRRSTNGQR